MSHKNCMEIVKLEERLACLIERYKDLTEELVSERENGMISEDNGNYYDIASEIVLIKRQIDSTERMIKACERIHAKGKSNTIEVGSCVRLENHRLCLKIFLVPKEEASPALGYISDVSPLGKAIIGKREGDSVKVNLPSGEISYLVKGVS